MIREADFSPCRTYRYSLYREWGTGGLCTFVLLNPSTADAVNDDPTNRRCINFAKQWGFGAVCHVNLFAYRTHPKHPLYLKNDTALQPFV